MGNDRTITRDGHTLAVAYPVAWDRSFAWRHLLAHPPEGVRQPRRQSHRQLWAKAHTANAWVWTTTLAATAEDTAA